MPVTSRTYAEQASWLTCFAVSRALRVVRLRQLPGPARPAKCVAGPSAPGVQGQGIGEEADRLVVGVVAQRLLAGLLQVVDRPGIDLGLAPVMRQQRVQGRQVVGM